jgi:hypothetical protein
MDRTRLALLWVLAGALGHLAPASARPRIELPRPGANLCPTVVLRFAGLRAATRRFPGLHVVVSIDGHVIDMAHMEKTGSRTTIVPAEFFDTNDATLALAHGQHAACLELVNRTNEAKHFVVYQHLVAFNTSGATGCLSPDAQRVQQVVSMVSDEDGDRRPARTRQRQDAGEQHMWRGTPHLLESLSIFPPATSDWKPRAGARMATTQTDWQPAGNASKWSCRPYSGFCWKDYHVPSRFLPHVAALL